MLVRKKLPHKSHALIRFAIFSNPMIPLKQTNNTKNNHMVLTKFCDSRHPQWSKYSVSVEESDVHVKQWAIPVSRGQKWRKTICEEICFNSLFISYFFLNWFMGLIMFVCPFTGLNHSAKSRQASSGKFTLKGGDGQEQNLHWGGWRSRKIV